MILLRQVDDTGNEQSCVKLGATVHGLAAPTMRPLQPALAQLAHLRSCLGRGPSRLESANGIRLEGQRLAYCVQVIPGFGWNSEPRAAPYPLKLNLATLRHAMGFRSAAARIECSWHSIAPNCHTTLHLRLHTSNLLTFAL